MTIIIKRSSVAAKVPTTANLSLGELAMNTYDGKLYLKKNDGSEAVKEVGPVYSVAGRTGNVVIAYTDLTGRPTLGTAAAQNIGAFATAAQGTTADAALPKAGGTMTGLLLAPAMNDAVVTLTGTTPTINLAAGGEFRITPSGNTTFSVSNPPASGYTTTKTIRVTQGATARTLTWWAGIQTVGGEIPADPAANETKEYTLRASNVGGTTTYVLTETGVVS
tara:strand:- start:960 stop:1622 length:663 start_codon:yes stop_codon:yes gene_type:complete